MLPKLEPLPRAGKGHCRWPSRPCSLTQFQLLCLQCYSCGNPETVIKVKKEDITLKCKACGSVSSVDPRHKLNTFILKNPPEERKLKAVKQCVPRKCMKYAVGIC